MTVETSLMRSVNGFACISCFHYCVAPTGSEVIPSVPFCKYRNRQIGWNSSLFVCGNYGAGERRQTTIFEFGGRVA